MFIPPQHSIAALRIKVSNLPTAILSRYLHYIAHPSIASCFWLNCAISSLTLLMVFYTRLAHIEAVSGSGTLSGTLSIYIALHQVGHKPSIGHKPSYSHLYPSPVSKVHLGSGTPALLLKQLISSHRWHHGFPIPIPIYFRTVLSSPLTSHTI